MLQVSSLHLVISNETSFGVDMQKTTHKSTGTVHQSWKLLAHQVPCGSSCRITVQDIDMGRTRTPSLEYCVRIVGEPVATQKVR